MGFQTETGFNTTLSQKLDAGVSDATIILASLPKTVTEGVMLIGSGTNKEWVYFATVSAGNVQITGCNRGLDKDATSVSDVTTTNILSHRVGDPVRLVQHSLSQNNQPKLDSDNTFTGDNTHAGIEDFDGELNPPIYADATARDAAITSPREGSTIKNTALGVKQSYIGGAWVDDAADTTANGSETVSGRWEGATVAEQGAATPSGSVGPLAVQNKYLVKIATFTPAFLTGDTGAESVAATWAAITSTGYFKISIDGTEYDDVNPDFTGDTDMDNVAASIQVAIRAATSGLETCAWDTDHLIISSVLTTASSAITVTSTPSSGTDISGAGASDWMDCDTGNGVVTNKVTANENKIGLLGATGKYPDDFIDFASNIILPTIYGNGAVGDLVTSGNVTLTADTYYTNLTITAGDTLYTNGYRLFAKGTLTNDGTISYNGGDGGGGGTGTGAAGGVGGWKGAVVAGVTVPSAIDATAGGAGGFNGVGASSLAGTNKAYSYYAHDGNVGGRGGTCTSFGPFSGGAGGAVGTTTDNRIYLFGDAIAELLNAERDGTLHNVSGNSTGGGGGGSGNSQGAGGGGGGGASGGFLAIYAYTLINNGVIEANGGNGGNGGDAMGASPSGIGAGGGGGNGGVILLVYNTTSGAGTTTVTAGALGAKGSIGVTTNSTEATVGSVGIVISSQIG